MPRKTKMNRRDTSYREKTVPQPVVITLFAGVLFLVFTAHTGAYSVGENFAADPAVFRPGTIVSVMPEDSTEIQPTTLQNSQHTLGVISQSGSNSVTYLKNNADVTVTIEGEVYAYVSDLNGTPETGDLIAPSSLAGIGQVATATLNPIGVALEDFSAQDAQTYQGVSSEGDGQVAVDSVLIRLIENEAQTQIQDQNNGLQGILSSISGRYVSSLRLVLVVGVFMASLLFAVASVNSSIRTSFISIGRNPMSSPAIYHSLLRVTAFSVAVLLTGAAVSYVVLVW